MLLNRPWKPWPYRNLEPAFPIYTVSIIAKIVMYCWYDLISFTEYLLHVTKSKVPKCTRYPTTHYMPCSTLENCRSLTLGHKVQVPGTKYQQDIWETETILVPSPACIWVQMSKSSALMTKPRPVELKSKKFKFGFNITLWPPRHQYFVTADILETGMANLIDQYSSALI